MEDVPLSDGSVAVTARLGSIRKVAQQSGGGWGKQASKQCSSLVCAFVLVSRFLPSVPAFSSCPDPHYEGLYYKIK